MRDNLASKNFGGDVNFIRIGLNAVYGFFVLIYAGLVYRFI